MSAQLKEVPAVIKASFAEAFRHHEAGRLDKAQRGYRDILAIDPVHANSLYLLGVINAHIRALRPLQFTPKADG